MTCSEMNIFNTYDIFVKLINKLCLGLTYITLQSYVFLSCCFRLQLHDDFMNNILPPGSVSVNVPQFCVPPVGGGGGGFSGQPVGSVPGRSRGVCHTAAQEKLPSARRVPWVTLLSRLKERTHQLFQCRKLLQKQLQRLQRLLSLFIHLE